MAEQSNSLSELIPPLAPQVKKIKRLWTLEADEEIRTLADSGLGPDQIARRTRRTPAAIKSRARVLGIRWRDGHWRPRSPSR
jgi:hypothetical protein